MDKRISRAAKSEQGLSVTIDGQDKFFSWLWIRDHSQDPQTFHQAARQRLVETFNLGELAPARDVTVDAAGSMLIVRWANAPEARFTADYLATIAPPTVLYDVIGDAPVLWDASHAVELCHSVEHAAFVEDDRVLADALENLRRYGMVSLKNVPLNIAASRRVMERIAYIRTSIFGDMWELKSDGKMADTGSTPLEITPHSDGTYNRDAPGLMSLHCLAYEATGGDNILVDGFNIAHLLKERHPEAYETLSTVPVPGQYLGDGAYLVAQRPPLRHDAAGRLVQVSFNNHDRAPFNLPEPQMSQLYDALGMLDRLVKDRANQFIFGQRPGDMVIFDNWRLMHGRMAFEGQRHMVGSYLNREDFESRIRMLASRPLDMVAETTL